MKPFLNIEMQPCCIQVEFNEMISMDTVSFKEQFDCIDAVLTVLSLLSCGSQSKFRAIAEFKHSSLGNAGFLTLFKMCNRAAICAKHSVSFRASTQYSLLVGKLNC